MKKKNLVVKGMAMLMACALVAGNTGIVAHATEDGLYHGDGRENGGNDNSASIPIGGEAPVPAPAVLAEVQAVPAATPATVAAVPAIQVPAIAEAALAVPVPATAIATYPTAHPR